MPVNTQDANDVASKVLLAGLGSCLFIDSEQSGVNLQHTWTWPTSFRPHARQNCLIQAKRNLRRETGIGEYDFEGYGGLFSLADPRLYAERISDVREDERPRHLHPIHCEGAPNSSTPSRNLSQSISSCFLESSRPREVHTISKE